MVFMARLSNALVLWLDSLVLSLAARAQTPFGVSSRVRRTLSIAPLSSHTLPQARSG